MTISGFKIIECPYCTKQYKSRLIGSFGTYGAELYSDGYISSCFIPESLDIIKCYNDACGNFFRGKEAKVVAELDRDDFNNPLWKDTIYLGGYQINAIELEEALEQAFCKTKDEEIIIRTMLLHRYNDLVRYDRSLDFSSYEEEKSLTNIGRLLALLTIDEENINRMLLRAELFREKGDFDYCIQTLQGLKTDSAFILKRIQKIYSQAKIKDSKVANLNEAAIKKEYQCDQCKKSIIVFDLDKLNSPYAYQYYRCVQENKVFTAPSKHKNPKKSYQLNFWQKLLHIKKPYENFILRKNVPCNHCNSPETELFTPSKQKCIECKSGSYTPVKWFDVELKDIIS